jgi:uncharacterized repeat protein (TIGR03803 family)
LKAAKRRSGGKVSKLNWATKACGVFLLWAAAAAALPAQTFRSLLSFDLMDGHAPAAPLVQGTDGNFYGTTLYGGTVNDDAGTVFKITPDGTLTTLYSFGGATGGVEPLPGLIQATNGDLYGTTWTGGLDNGGTIFKITTSGTLTTLYEFCTQNEGGHCTDGYGPRGGLLQASDGNFYGTTYSMGSLEAGGGGTLFKVTPSGTLTVLYNFCSQSVNGDCLDGGEPTAALVQATNGDLYGTTSGGGTNLTCLGAFGNGCGTIFKITPSGAFTSLFSFDGTDGESPEAALVQATNGDLYGTTVSGGTSEACYNGCGTVFKITPSGIFTTLLSFDETDGADPDGALIQATDGNLYGAVQEGGTDGGGTIVRITLSGTLTTLYSGFEDGPNGGFPDAGMVQGTDGIFYGTTSQGGVDDNCCGTVFSLSVGLRPFVKTQPTSSPVGGTIRILGSNLTGATSVTFNGTAAVFTVDSQYLITTTVPAGATSGKVEVTVPGATLSSNVPFEVK